MGDTDVNVYIKTQGAHWMGGAPVDPAQYQIRIHLGTTIDTTFTLTPDLSCALAAACMASGPVAWPSMARPGVTELARPLAVRQVLMRQPDWFGIEATLGEAMTQSAVRSLIMAVRYPLG